jgi:predicted homoserine dehydrogenase-like protein
LTPGEILDGEGGYTVFGKLAPAAKSVAQGCVPLGLAHNLKVVRPIAKDQAVTWDDVEIAPSLAAFTLRREMEQIHFGNGVR